MSTYVTQLVDPETDYIITTGLVQLQYGWGLPSPKLTHPKHPAKFDQEHSSRI